MVAHHVGHSPRKQCVWHEHVPTPGQRRYLCIHKKHASCTRTHHGNMTHTPTNARASRTRATQNAPKSNPEVQKNIIYPGKNRRCFCKNMKKSKYAMLLEATCVQGCFHATCVQAALHATCVLASLEPTLCARCLGSNVLPRKLAHNVRANCLGRNVRARQLARTERYSTHNAC